MGKATIRDVARVSGLSLGTISKYMNGGTVKESNREKIDAAVKKLNYSVDEYARGLITNRTKTIGILVPEFNNLFFSEIVSRLERELNKFGYAVAACESFYDKDKEERGVQWLMSRRMDAIIMIPCGHVAEEYKYLSKVGIPIIFLDRYIADLDCEYVVVNNREICKECIGYLIDHGHRDIAVVAAYEGLYTADERVKGYYDAFREHGIDVNEALIFRVNEGANDAYHVVKRLLKNRECTALFAANYYATLGSMFAINEKRIAVPDELSFVGFDDTMFTNIYRPKLTIVDQPVDEMAACVTKRLLEMMEDENYEYRLNELHCSFKINSSTAAR